MKHYKPVFIKFSMSSPLAQTQSPLLKTFWRRFRLRILYTSPWFRGVSTTWHDMDVKQNNCLIWRIQLKSINCCMTAASHQAGIIICDTPVSLFTIIHVKSFIFTKILLPLHSWKKTLHNVSLHSSCCCRIAGVNLDNVKSYFLK